MAQFGNFTVDNGAIRDLRELIFLTLFKDPELNMTATPKTGVQNGKKLGFLNQFGDVGINSCGCDPSYKDLDIDGI